jgi:hypothetical protein
MVRRMHGPQIEDRSRSRIDLISGAATPSSITTAPYAAAAPTTKALIVDGEPDFDHPRIGINAQCSMIFDLSGVALRHLDGRQV